MVDLRARLRDAGGRLERHVHERPRDSCVNLALVSVVVVLAADLLPVPGGLTLAIASLALVRLEERRQLRRRDGAADPAPESRSTAPGAATRGDGS